MLVLLFIIIKSNGQHHYEQPIKNVTSQWHQIELPDEIYRSLQTSYASIRVYGHDEAGTAVEQPYVLKKEIPRQVLRELDAEIINRTRQGDNYFFTFKITDTLLLSQIELEIENEAFDWKITLEGSNDQRDWFTVLEDYRIIAIPDAYRFTRLDFSPVNFPFLRLKIRTTEKPVLSTAKIFTAKRTKGVYKEWTPISVTHNKPEPDSKISSLLIDLGRPLPVSYLKIMPDADYDYYRGFTTWLLKDSTKTAKGWRENWSRAAAGTLSSFDNNIFTYPEQITTRIRVDINNQDNQPLNIPSVQVKGAKHTLLVRFDNKPPYLLHYGNNNLRTPSYDIAKFKNKLPENPVVASLGKVSRVPDVNEKKENALFENSLWLYLLMGIIILVLGTFTLKMIKSESEK